MSAEAPFRVAWETYCKQVDDIALATLTARVWPLLRRRRLTLLSGNGTYLLVAKGGKPITRDETKDPALLAIFDVLDTPIPGMNYPLGSLGFDFDPEGAE